jgi:hypothetical protein
MSWLFHGIVALVVKAFNGLIAVLAAAANAVLSLLPGMPSFPTMPTQVSNVLGWINWFFPVGTLVDILTTLVAAWLIWMVVRVPLRWAKVINE